ncbi:MAG: BLUF domain-containing protein [Rubripirellula sp.]
MAHFSEDPDQLIQLVYASAATVQFSEEDLEQLLEYARNNNASLNVTGILLFKDNTFFQVLEGHRGDVEALYDKIGLDKRHDNVLLLTTNEIEERNFGEWKMGFVHDATVIDSLPGFVDFFNGRTFVDLMGDSKRMRQVLDGFRRGRWRRTCEQVDTVDSQ